MSASEYTVGWGTLTLINAGLAQSKGRSGLAWWLLSLPLGPVATMLIVIQHDGEGASTVRDPLSRDRIYGVTISTHYFPAIRRAGHYLLHAVTVWARVGGSGAGADHRRL